MVFRAEDLRRSGGFAAIADYLADDYQLGLRMTRLGLRVEFAPQVVETDLGCGNWHSVWNHQLRWLRTIRSINPLGFAFLCLTFTTPWLLTSALLGLGFENGPDLAQSAADTLVDLSTSFGLSARLLLHFRSARSWRAFWRDLPLIPLRDALLCLQWLAALFGSSVVWRGVRIPLDDARDRYDANASDSR